MDVALERQACQQIGKTGLDLLRVLSEELLELVDDHQGLLVTLAPTSHQGHGDVWLVEVEELLDRLDVAGELSGQRSGQGLGRTVPRLTDQRRPPFRPDGQQPGPDEGALAGPGRPDEGEQVRPPELAPHRFDLELATEEILGVVLGEGRQARIRPHVLRPGHPQRDLL